MAKQNGTNMMMDRQFDEAFPNVDYEQELRAEFENSINDRLERHTSVRPSRIISYTDFGAVLSECHFLYRDGYYFACIALCQSFGEALSRFLYRRISKRTIKDHMTRVKRLTIAGRISAESEPLFGTIDNRGNKFYHLNSNMMSQGERLRVIALEVLEALSKIVNDVFAFTSDDGIMIPKHPDLWNPKTLKTLQQASPAFSTSRDSGGDLKNNTYSIPKERFFI
jgi:hypothetical protein